MIAKDMLVSKQMRGARHGMNSIYTKFKTFTFVAFPFRFALFSQVTTCFSQKKYKNRGFLTHMFGEVDIVCCCKNMITTPIGMFQAWKTCSCFYWQTNKTDKTLPCGETLAFQQGDSFLRSFAVFFSGQNHLR